MTESVVVSAIIVAWTVIGCIIGYGPPLWRWLRALGERRREE